MGLFSRRMVVFWATAGALGNQLFHLAALDAVCSGARLGFLFTSYRLGSIFDWRRKSVWIVNRAYQRIPRAVEGLSRFGLVAVQSEGNTRTKFGDVGTGDLTDATGSGRPIWLVKEAYLQSDQWISNKFKHNLSFKPEIQRRAEQFRKAHQIDWATTIFVHIRRGDYKTYSVLGRKDLTLPTPFYLAGIERLRAALPVSRVLLVTDEPDFARAEFVRVSDHLVVSNDAALDLCLMAQCASGVLSPSTFSWWGATLGPQLAPPIAPRYWLGWRQAVTFPAGIATPRFEYLPVEAEADCA